MLSIHNSNLVNENDCMPTEIEFINFVQTYSFFQKKLIYKKPESVVQYFLKISQNLETTIKYLVICGLFNKNELLKDVIKTFKEQIKKFIKTESIKQILDYISKNNLQELEKLYIKYKNYLDN